MSAVSEIVNIEWEMFAQVNNVGGQASCQQDKDSFMRMRNSQVRAWNEKTRIQYLADLTKAKIEGRNLMTEKYAHMMKSTFRAEYERIRHLLLEPSERVKEKIEEIIKIYLEWKQELDLRYPSIAKGGRPALSSADSQYVTSYETYFRGELYTYSGQTIDALHEYASQCSVAGRNLGEEELLYMVKEAGFQSLEAAEEAQRRLR